jgi:NADPH-dependent 2,4-dienoyl-CoA reductase/sulfur reductase-like enzyme/rhodanese-related sulfurtransferase
MPRVLIVGGVAGGASTAARLRRVSEESEIVLFERGQYISYANCGLPYYIGGVITDRNRLFVQTPAAFSSRFVVDVRVSSEVTSIDPKDRSIRVKDLGTGRVSTERYDKLVLSPGAEPVRPPIPGIDAEGIFTLRSVADTDRIKAYIDTRKPKRAAVIGAGFIGLEMAENLSQLGMEVTIVEMAGQVMTPLDFEMAAEVHQHLRSRKVELYLKEAVAAFGSKGGRITVTLSGGRLLSADLVILGIGVRPENTLAREAGLALGKRGGIVVNEFLQTSDPDIYALGDAIEFPSAVTGRPASTYLAGPANKQARIVADNIAFGNSRRYRGAVGTAVAKVYDVTVACTGLSEKALRAEGVPFLFSITHSGSHAGYYPGALPMSIKLLFSPADGKILGAQVVGYDGVDKRIDVIAALLRMGGTVRDLAEMEQAYAPPYSSAKDPVNIAGCAAENALDGLVKPVHWSDVASRDPASTFLLDVREPSEFAAGFIPGAVNIPLNSLRKRIDEVPRDKKIIVYCGVGLRAYVGCRILTQRGYADVSNMAGGWKTWGFVSSPQANEGIFAHDIVGTDGMIYQGGAGETKA